MGIRLDLAALVLTRTGLWTRRGAFQGRVQPNRYGLPSLFPSTTMTSSNRDAFTGTGWHTGHRAEAMVEGCGHCCGERLEAALGKLIVSSFGRGLST